MVADLSSEIQDTSSSTEFRHVRMEYVRSYLAPQLVARGLGEEQIAQQTLEELRESLTRVDEALENTDPFKLPGRAGFKFLTFEISTEITRAQLYAVLLERKKQILERMSLVQPQGEMRELQEAIETTVENPGVRDSLIKLNQYNMPSRRSWSLMLCRHRLSRSIASVSR